MKRTVPPPPAPAASASAAAGWQAPLGLAARVVLAGLLLFSGIHKAAAPAEEFMVVIEGYGVLPDSLVPLFAKLVPWVEVLAGWLLLAGLHTKAAAAAAGALGLMFFSALAITKLKGIELPNCGCFGTSVHLERWQAMGLDVLMMLSAAAAWRFGRSGPALDNWIQKGV